MSLHLSLRLPFAHGRSVHVSLCMLMAAHVKFEMTFNLSEVTLLLVNQDFFDTGLLLDVLINACSSRFS